MAAPERGIVRLHALEDSSRISPSGEPYPSVSDALITSLSIAGARI